MPPLIPALCVAAVCLAHASDLRPDRSLTQEAAPPTVTQPVGPTSLPTTSAPSLDVGTAAPPIRATTWLGGGPEIVHERGATRVYVLAFWATWSGPSRAALPDLVQLHERCRSQGVRLVGVTDEPAEPVRAFLAELKPPLPFAIALDEHGATTRAYSEAAGVDFVPYSFVIGPDRTIAWHGHPQQTELATIIEQLLAGRYDAAAACELVRRARSVDHLEALFRDACEKGAWRTALLALDGLLQKDVPKERLWRYKLAILLGELEERDAARALAEELLAGYADNARFLNSLAWDVVSQPRLYQCDPEIALKFARAAYRVSGGRDAGIADTYARVLYLLGRLDLAIEVQTRAAEIAATEQREHFERMLSFYKRCQQLQATIEGSAK